MPVLVTLPSIGQVMLAVASSPTAPATGVQLTGRTLNAYCGLLEPAAPVPFGLTVIEGVVEQLLDGRVVLVEVNRDRVILETLNAGDCTRRTEVRGWDLSSREVEGDSGDIRADVGCSRAESDVDIRQNLLCHVW